MQSPKTVSNATLRAAKRIVIFELGEMEKENAGLYDRIQAIREARVRVVAAINKELKGGWGR